MSFNNLIYFLATALIWFSAGCAQGPSPIPSPELSSWAVRLDVPFVAQAESNDCGPAALATVLHYYGYDIDLMTISGQIFTPKLGRTLLADMENYARSLGLQTQATPGSLSLLKQNLDANIPIIALLDLGPTFFVQGHYVVIHGYTENGFLAHMGTSPSVYLSQEELFRRWQPMNYLCLIVEP